MQEFYMLDSIKSWASENKQFLVGLATGAGTVGLVTGGTAIYKSRRERNRQQAIVDLQTTAMPKSATNAS
jgi:hypothetical protein